MKRYRGWWIPDADAVTGISVERTLDESIELVLRYCEQRGVCVQAGGCFGMYAQQLAWRFGQVYTFEPNPEAFECLGENVTRRNVYKARLALWDRRARLSLTADPSDPGRGHTKEGGEIPATTIDAYQLAICDLVYLDIEGAEYRALKGAELTLKRCRPVVAFEANGLERQCGDAPGAALKFLEGHGYRRADQIHKDVIMVPA